MTNLNFKILILTFFTSILIGCKTKTAKIQQIEAEVYFRLLENSQELHAEVFFYEKKSPPVPVVWRNVLFVNVPMKKRQLSPEQIRYIIDLKNPEFKNQYYVKFWNKGELPNQIDIVPTEINSFSFEGSSGNPLDFLDKSQPVTLTVDAPSFSGKEKVTLLFTNENNESSTIQIDTPKSSGKIELSPKALSNVPTGICNVELIISKAEILETPEVKSSVISEFYSKPIEVSIK